MQDVDARRAVLIIEDDAVFAEVLVEVARRSGFTAHVSDRGDAGIAMARHIAPTAVILDLRTPGLDGWVVLDRLRNDPATRKVPVCVVTGDDRRERALRLGAFTYLQKPASLEDIGQRLDRAGAFVSRAVKKVVLVDSDAARRASLAEALGGKNVEITAVATGGEAVGTSVVPDCVVVAPPLTDASLTDLVAELACRPWAAELPILVMDPAGSPLDTRLQRAAGLAFVHSVRSVEGMCDEVAARLHQTREGPRRSDRRLAGRRVLVVDDDPRNVFATSRLLEAHGIEVASATGGQQAIDMLSAGAVFDVVLMDIMMPGMDGYDAIRAIRAMPAQRSLPLLALTAKAMRGDRDRCLEAGATDYVPKPVDPDQLLAAMRVSLTT